MYKREQILLNDWLSDWFHHCAKKYDLSHSALIRITLCLQVGEWISKEHPRYKFNFSQQKMTSTFRKFLKNRQPEEELHKAFSELYFETRKAIEFLMAQEKSSDKMIK